jgi:hypothetical protein
MAEMRRRLHRPVFRATVLRAYGMRCAVCALRHAQLLDAAHIVPDRKEHGIAAARNGLALCKIHNAAYDSFVLGYDRIWSWRSTPTCSTRSTARCWNMGSRAGTASG